MSDPLSDPKTLPLQVFTTAASLLEVIDKRVSLTLRDGRTFLGELRSFDSFGNIVLQDTVERIYLDGKYAEESRGVWIVRGENIALLGELDLEQELEARAALEQLEKIDFRDAEAQLTALKTAFTEEYNSKVKDTLSLGLDPSIIGGNPHLY